MNRNIKLQSLIVPIVALTALLADASSSNAAVIYSSLGPGDTFNTFTGAVISGDSFGNLQSSAATAFNTGAFDWRLESLDIAICYGGGNNSFVVSIAEDSSGLPGNVLENISISNVPSTSAVFAVPLTTSIFLNANTTYWITLTGAGDASGEWYSATSSSSPGATRLGAGDWSIHDFAQALRVNGAAAPEPSSLFVLGPILIIAMGNRIRRRKHATDSYT